MTRSRSTSLFVATLAATVMSSSAPARATVPYPTDTPYPTATALPTHTALPSYTIPPTYTQTLTHSASITLTPTVTPTSLCGIVENASFELAVSGIPTPWYFVGAGTLIFLRPPATPIATDGTNSVGITSGSPSGASWWAQNVPGIIPGNGYEARANVRVTGVTATTGGALVRLVFRDSGGAALSGTVQSVPTAGTGGYTLQRTGPSIAPAGAVEAEVRLVLQDATGTVHFDLACLYPPDTPTPTPTRTVTATYTFTRTRTRTATFTFTDTETETETRTDTATETESGTPTETPTDTVNPSFSRTPTGTASATVNPLYTATDTPTESGTRTDTVTRTGTRTRTDTRTGTASRTPTPTDTGTPSDTPTGTDTGTGTSTPTITASSTETPTFVPVLGNLVFQNNPQGPVAPATTPIDYQFDFRNTGLGDFDNVWVGVLLDPWLDPSTFALCGVCAAVPTTTPGALPTSTPGVATMYWHYRYLLAGQQSGPVGFRMAARNDAPNGQILTVRAFVFDASQAPVPIMAVPVQNQVIIPAGLAADAVSLLPVNVAAGTSGVSVQEIRLSAGTGATGRTLGLRNLRMHAQTKLGTDDAGAASLISGMELRTSAGLPVARTTAAPGQAVFDFAFATPLPILPGTTMKLRAFADFPSSAPAESTFQISLPAASDFVALDALSQGTPLAVSGVFPLVAGPARIVAAAEQNSFVAYPNPGTKARPPVFQYFLASPATVSLRIYDLSGRPVRTLIERKVREAGLHSETTWDLRNGVGREVLDGVYAAIWTAQPLAGGAAKKMTIKLAVAKGRTKP